MKILLVKLVLFTLALVFGLVIFELFLRTFTKEPENLAKLQSSSGFLYENKPGADFVYGVSEFKTDVHINANGFRDNEFRQAKDDGKIRVAVLGDSQEEAFQVDLPDTWQKVMAKKLSGDLDKSVETFNFGVSGYGTDQEWLTLSKKVWQFAPDMVVLAFSPNDVGDTYKNKLIRIEDERIIVISANERAEGNFLGKMARETYLYHTIIKASAGSPTLKSLVDRARVKILGFPKEDRFFLSDAQLVQGPFEVFASVKNPPAEVEDTWKVISALISDMKRQAEEHNAEFLVTINIPRAQVDPSGWETIRDQYHLDANNSSPYTINEKLADITHNLNIDFYDPRLDAIEWYKKTGNIHWPIDAHFNVNGNLFMGTKVAEFIEDKKLVK